MNKKYMIKAVLDGLIQGFTLYCLVMILLSLPVSYSSFISCLLAGGILGIISASIYFILVRKESRKNIIKFSIISIIFFILFNIIALVIRMQFHLNILPLRELGNGDGILILFICAFFLIPNFVLRFITCVVLFIQKKTGKKTGDGSMS